MSKLELVMLESLYIQWKEIGPAREWLIWPFKHLTYSRGTLSPFVVSLHAVCLRWGTYHFLQVRICNRKAAPRVQPKDKSASKGAVNSPGPWQGTAWATCRAFTSRLSSFAHRTHLSSLHKSLMLMQTRSSEHPVCLSFTRAMGIAAAERMLTLQINTFWDAISTNFIHGFSLTVHAGSVWRRHQITASGRKCTFLILIWEQQYKSIFLHSNL